MTTTRDPTAEYRQRLLENKEVNLSWSFDKFMGDETFIQIWLPLFTSRKGKHEQELYLGGNSLSDDSILALARVLALGTHKSLQVLDVSYNLNIKDDGICCLLAVLPASCPLLEELVLRGTAMGDETLARLHEILPRMKNLVKLNLSTRSVTEKGCFVLGRMLSLWPNLTSLNMECSGANVTAQGIRALVRGMRGSRLTDLCINVDNCHDPTFEVRREIDNIKGFIKIEFPCMVALCSVRVIKRLGNECFLKMLPVDMYRRVAVMLYELMDI